MAFTAKDVMQLREMSGAGMMDCKKALNECDGDMEKAMDYLREKSLAASAKKASRIAAEGVVEAYISDKIGVLVEVNCETDFVAKTDAFYDLAHDVAEHIAKKNPATVEELMDQTFSKDESKTVSALVNEAVAKIGEKITVRRFSRYELTGEGVIETYIHMGGKIGVMVELDGPANNELAHDIAMHIAAAKPGYVRRDEVDTTELEKESEILRAQAINEGKPEKIVEKIVSGRIEKYYQEVCLLEQAFVKDPDKTIAQLVEGVSADITVRKFERFEMGEGLQKREDNFAEEVMSQMK